jgi:hypothetical protein
MKCIHIEKTRPLYLPLCDNRLWHARNSRCNLLGRSALCLCFPAVKKQQDRVCKFRTTIELGLRLDIIPVQYTEFMYSYTE